MQINISHQVVKKAIRRQKNQMMKYSIFNYRHIFSKCHKNLSHVYQKQAGIGVTHLNYELFPLQRGDPIIRLLSPAPFGLGALLFTKPSYLCITNNYGQHRKKYATNIRVTTQVVRFRPARHLTKKPGFVMKRARRSTVNPEP